MCPSMYQLLFLVTHADFVGIYSCLELRTYVVAQLPYNLGINILHMFYAIRNAHPYVCMYVCMYDHPCV